MSFRRYESVWCDNVQTLHTHTLYPLLTDFLGINIPVTDSESWHFVSSISRIVTVVWVTESEYEQDNMSGSIKLCWNHLNKPEITS